MKTIVCFGALGDTINSTYIVKHYKEMGYKIRYITNKKVSKVIKNNLLIDQIIEYDFILGNINEKLKPYVHLFDTKMRSEELIMKYGKEDVIFAAPYSDFLNFKFSGGQLLPIDRNNGGLVKMPMDEKGEPIGSLLRYIKDKVPKEEQGLVEFMPYVYLSEDEKKEATSYIADLDSSKPNVLIEYEFKSEQSVMNYDIIKDLIDFLGKTKELNIIFSGLSKPSIFDILEEKYSKHSIYFYNKSFMSNAELYNHCDYFISSCSGIHCLTSSNYCKNANVKRFEFCRGDHWASTLWKHNNENKHVIFSHDQLKEILEDLDE